MAMHDSEIIFSVREDEIDGGYNAATLGFDIFTQGDSLDEVRPNVREAVDVYFDDSMEAPKVIRLHFVKDEILAR